MMFSAFDIIRIKAPLRQISTRFRVVLIENNINIIARRYASHEWDVVRYTPQQ